jgi:hypothetical protein
MCGRKTFLVVDQREMSHSSRAAQAALSARLAMVDAIHKGGEVPHIVRQVVTPGKFGLIVARLALPQRVRASATFCSRDACLSSRPDFARDADVLRLAAWSRRVCIGDAALDGFHRRRR